MVKILPYNSASLSARLIAEGLNARRLRVDGTSRWTPRQDGTDVVINWGRGFNDNWPFLWNGGQVRILNEPRQVTLASRKDLAAVHMQENNILQPDFTNDRDEVNEWLEEGHTVLARTLMNASGGRGIIKLTEPGVDIPNAPLYTKYIKKQSEWRVHVVDAKILSVQRKISRPGVEPKDWQIRNHDNGFIFQREWDGRLWHPEIAEESLKVVEAFGLDFGAVDIIWNDNRQSPYVLEVNTAPGLEGSTLEEYLEAFEEMVG